MPPETKQPVSSGIFRTLIALLGGLAGAVWGAIAGARMSVQVANAVTEHPDEIQTAQIPAVPVEAHRFTPELRFPSRPARDWVDSKPAELPKPTYAPATFAFGVTLAAAGVVTSVWVSLVGLILFILGLANWIGALLHEHQ